MWVALSAVGGFVGAVLLKFLDVMFEGRGAWRRRTIRADIDLWTGLPGEIQGGVGGRALRERIDAELIAFSSPGEHEPTGDADLDDQLRHREFWREVDDLTLRWMGFFTLGLALAAAVVTILDGPPDFSEEMPSWVLFSAMIAGYVTYSAVRAGVQRIAAKVVAKRWRTAGRILPAGVE